MDNFRKLSRLFVVTSAGFPPPFLWRAPGPVEFLPSGLFRDLLGSGGVGCWAPFFGFFSSLLFFNTPLGPSCSLRHRPTVFFLEGFSIFEEASLKKVYVFSNDLALRRFPDLPSFPRLFFLLSAVLL